MTEQLIRTATPEATGTLRPGDGVDDMMARLEALDPLLRAEAGSAEAGGRLTPRVEEALHASGVWAVGMPRELGGGEFTPRQQITAIETLARADASTAWVVMAVEMITGATAAYLGEPAWRQLGAGDDVLAAGQGTRPGRAVAVEGGYLVSGSWQFASGLHHATHVHTAALDEQAGEMLVFTLPKEQATLVDNWDVMGLRATGSIDYHLDEVFVPAEFVYSGPTTEPLVGGGLYRLGVANLAGIGHTGWALGVARRLLDEMRTIATAKTGTRNAGVDTAEFHADYARAEASLLSARAWNMEVWADNEAMLDRGETLSTDQETLTRLALNTATWTAHEIGQTVYRWAGTAALREGPLNRVFRDLHGGTQHVTSGAGVLHGCGRRLAGLAPEARWVFLDLVG
ncbi:acyl-CoA dehydrogenase family protein [Actinomycetospora sp.]|uniref:acyl-CoA dehydrogenase family protein n=1 Tax=Actinomycetospora sp. TaxID=1872135 RepID=UPI002F419014